MDIKVEVGTITLDTVIGQHRVYHPHDDEYGTEDLTLGQAIAATVFEDLRREDYYGDLKRKAVELRTEAIREALAPVVAEAVTAPVQKTNQYGESIGQPVSMREVIVAEVERLLKQPADNYSRDKGTWVQVLVRTEAEAVLKKELAGVIAEEKTKVVAAVRGKAADLIAESIKAGLGK